MTQGTRAAFRGYDNGRLDWSACHAVERDPERVSGAWFFVAHVFPLLLFSRILKMEAVSISSLNGFRMAAHSKVQSQR
jgi:hypothetical protein